MLCSRSPSLTSGGSGLNTSFARPIPTSPAPASPARMKTFRISAWFFALLMFALPLRAEPVAGVSAPQQLFADGLSKLVALFDPAGKGQVVSTTIELIKVDGLPKEFAGAT